jgi:hypothetical protein
MKYGSKKSSSFFVPFNAFENHLPPYPKGDDGRCLFYIELFKTTELKVTRSNFLVHGDGFFVTIENLVDIVLNRCFESGHIRINELDSL